MRQHRLSIVFLVIVILAGCSNDPNEVGLGLIPTRDMLKVDSLKMTSTFDSSFLARSTGQGTTLVGEYDDMEARTVMQFSGFSSIPTTSRIDSAIVAIPINYAFKNSMGTLAFTVHEMLQGWSQSTFTWDSSEATGEYNATADTSFLSNVTVTDSFIYFRIDPLVRRWVLDTTNTPDGFILLPSGPSTNIIIGARSISDSETRPLLTVSYVDSADTTVTWTRRTTQLLFVGNAPLPNSGDTLTIHAGISHRGWVRFDSLLNRLPGGPLPKRVSITQATLQLTRDNSASLLNSFSRDSLVVSLLLKDYAPYDSLTYSTLCSPTTDNTGHVVYSADVKTIVQLWATRVPNIGFVVRAYNEGSSVDRFALDRSSNPDSTLRPKLTIKYTLMP